MTNTLRTVFAALLAVATPLSLAPIMAGCAASAPKSNTPVQLNGTKWVLVIAGGRMDGRVVQFKKQGIGYLGYLVDKGQRLLDVTGLRTGPETMIFSFKPRGVNQYEGIYHQIAPDGSTQDKEVDVFIDGDSLNWNLETATWERVKE